jgi:hypothetical protein
MAQETVRLAARTSTDTRLRERVEALLTDPAVLKAANWRINHYGPLDAEPFRWSRYESPAHAAFSAIFDAAAAPTTEPPQGSVGPVCSEPKCPIYARHRKQGRSYPPHGQHDFRAAASTTDTGARDEPKPGSLEYAQMVAERYGDLDHETEEETR